MWFRVKKWGCYLSIIVLLPYVLTVFLNGPGIISASAVDERKVRVRIGTDEDADEDTDEGKTVEMSLEDYGIAVMAREIPASYEIEALKAQAVLVRTEIYKALEEQGSGAALEEAFWTQEDMEKDWGVAKYSHYYHRLQRAWQETDSKVLMKDQKAAAAPFCRLTNGSTRSGAEVLGEAYAYLQPVDCAADIEAQEQIQTVTVADMDAEIVSCDSGGYVLAVRVGEEQMSGEEFRTEYLLASSCFTLQKFNGKLRITTRGVGHGLGMSQYTANKLAKEGSGYEDILAYFFEELEIQEVADIVGMEE